MERSATAGGGYSLGWSPERRANCIRLDLNEFDFEHHLELALGGGMGQFLREAHMYSDPERASAFLTQTLGIPAGHGLMTAGSDECLQYVSQCFVCPETTPIYMFTPTYGYAETLFGSASHRTVTRIALDFCPSESPPDICTALSFYDPPKGALVYVVNPNNPLGLLVQREKLREAALAFPEVLFLVDEAYMEFSSQDESFLPWISLHTNVLVMKTFSKAYGLAGVRLGYLAGHPTLVDRIRTSVYNEKNVTHCALQCGKLVMAHVEHYMACAEEVRRQRDQLVAFLGARGWAVVTSSEGNFITLWADHQVQKTLEHHGISVRAKDPGFLRISIGRPEHMQAVKAVFEMLEAPSTVCPQICLYTPKKHVWALKMLFKDFVGVLEAAQFSGPWWLDSGSLLGWHRHAGGMIPWDDDIDVGILEQAIPELLRLKETLRSRGMRLKMNRTEAYYQIDRLVDSTSPTTGDLHIDIFPFVARGDVLVNADPRFVEPDAVRCNFKYTESDLFPLRPARWYETVSIYVPHNTKTILDSNIPSDYMHLARVEKQGVVTEFSPPGGEWQAA